MMPMVAPFSSAPIVITRPGNQPRTTRGYTTSTPVLSLRDEHGVELYYNVTVTPWCHVTPDLQMITPFRERADPSLIVGLRAKIDF